MIYKRFRNSSYRLHDFDYGSKGKYFITINVKASSKGIATVSEKNNKISHHLLESGIIIEETWKRIPDHFVHVNIDEHILMPDHFHGIIIITSKSKMISDSGGGITGKKNPMLYEHMLGTVIRWFKAKASYEIRRTSDPSFKWQRNYYDAIIWNEKALMATRIYINQNPEKWARKHSTQK